jgi:hypothetical protein
MVNHLVLHQKHSMLAQIYRQAVRFALVVLEINSLLSNLESH